MGTNGCLQEALAAPPAPVPPRHADSSGGRPGQPRQSLAMAVQLAQIVQDRAQRRELAQVELARLVGRYPGDYRGAFGQHMCEGGIGGQDGCSRAPPVLR